jgi:hypothetical protein
MINLNRFTCLKKAVYQACWKKVFIEPLMLHLNSITTAPLTIRGKTLVFYPRCFLMDLEEKVQYVTLFKILKIGFCSVFGEDNVPTYVGVANVLLPTKRQ